MKKAIGQDSDGNRMAILAKLGESIFTVQDLATLWNIKNRNTLRMTLMRYTKRGLIVRIWRGLYSLQKTEKLNARLLGLKVMNKFSYISCETVLFEEGVINKRTTAICLVSSINKKFTLLGVNYICRKLPDELLYNSLGIEAINGVRQANKKRAIRDMNYFNAKKYYDANI